jgi:hypothetical protein
MEYMHGKEMTGLILKEPADETHTIAAFRKGVHLSLGPGLTLAP